MLHKPFGWLLALIATTTFTTPARAGNPFVELPRDHASTRAHGYAEMSSDACYQRLDDRGIKFERVKAGALVEAPTRLTGPLRGVAFRHLHPRTSGSIVDCRLLLALDDFAGVLRSQGVVETGYLAAYRPDRTGRAEPGRRHPAGLAMDIAWFKRDDGQRLVVEKDFEGRVGAKTCGRNAQKPSENNEHAIALRKLVCETAKARLFHLFLTPNYDRQHHDHMHVEVRRNVHWFLVQ